MKLNIRKWTFLFLVIGFSSLSAEDALVELQVQAEDQSEEITMSNAPERMFCEECKCVMENDGCCSCKCCVKKNCEEELRTNYVKPCEPKAAPVKKGAAKKALE